MRKVRRDEPCGKKEILGGIRMASYTYRTRGVCAREISFEIDGDTVHHVRFSSGCNGKGTSCPDQLANALKEAKEGKL